MNIANANKMSNLLDYKMQIYMKVKVVLVGLAIEKSYLYCTVLSTSNNDELLFFI